MTEHVKGAIRRSVVSKAVARAHHRSNTEPSVQDVYEIIFSSIPTGTIGGDDLWRLLEPLVEDASAHHVWRSSKELEAFLAVELRGAIEEVFGDPYSYRLQRQLHFSGDEMVVADIDYPLSSRHPYATRPLSLSFLGLGS